ncbi:FAD-dependent oxidoreductase [Pseudomonas sp. 3JA]|uniref:FAD-dependent oxidoreductase n=1 Tax=Pseudomonas sp. 3JA TaxID=3109347 RepID=UPI00300ADBA0
MKRRDFFQGMGATLALASAAPQAIGVTVPQGEPTHRGVAGRGSVSLAPIDARVDRITEIYTCLRPFRLTGPRIETQQLGNKLIVHNYGHGGSGWSLSWGSSRIALQLLQKKARNTRRLGVIGCGPIGLTSAILAQRAGLPVTLYAKEIPPQVASMGATGHWSPDSQFCAAPFASRWCSRWIEMADFSYKMYQDLLGLPGDPVQWYYGYKLSNSSFDLAAPRGEPEFAKFNNPNRRYQPIQVDLAPDEHPFSYPYVRRWQNLLFNINSYARLLLSDFLAAGGKIHIRHFESAEELLSLPEKTIINATGYGAKALFNDPDIVAIRGQTARLVQQPEIKYAIRAQDFLFIPRRDGLVVQYIDRAGSYDNEDDSPDFQEASDAVEQLAAVMAGLRY